MNRIQLLIWVIGLSIVGGATTTTPASAQPNNQSDVTGTNVYNNTTPPFGFEPLNKSELGNPSIQGVRNAITSLINDKRIRTSTKTSLIDLSERLNKINHELWDYKRELDQNIRDSSTSLSKDLAEADASCRANVSSCDGLNSLVADINTFLKNLEILRTTLVKNGQARRIF